LAIGFGGMTMRPNTGVIEAAQSRMKIVLHRVRMRKPATKLWNGCGQTGEKIWQARLRADQLMARRL
jgi:hypothetical protein